MTLIVNGISLVPYIAYGGVKWQRNDVDGESAGRTTDSGYLYRDRLSVKTRLDITCRPLTLQETRIVLNAVEPEFVTVRYTDPQAGTDVIKQMYSNNIPATFLMRRKDGTELWSGITFPLIER